MNHRYYSPLRPLSLGTFPKPQGNEILHIENFEERQNVPEIARQAWGYIEYKEALTGGGIKGNAAGLVGTLTQIKEIKQLCGLPFCGYMAKLETVRPSGVPDEVTVVFAEDVPYRACNGIEFDVMQEFVEGSRLLLTGKVQTLKDFQSGRLLVYILADFVTVSEKAVEQDEAAVRGVIANKPTYRETPRGKRITDITVMYELRLLAGNGYTQELTAYEKTRLVERTKAALIRAKEEDGLEIQGKMRDLVAAMINESSTNVARMDAINNNATPEIKEQLKEGKLGITAAYEAAKLGEDEQREIAEKAAAGENVRAKEIAEKVAEKKAGDDYETPHPESITSLCYSCQKYKDCNVKTGTCQKCDQYINKAEAEKTDEQRYSEEQDAIDRQTKKKLQERADAEKMEHLPSEGNTEHKQHEIKIAASYYEDVVSGKKGFELRKNDRGYKQGDSLKMLEFKDGKHTGRTIDADIIYMLEDYTGLTDGYCILGIRVTDYTGKVSETDTESGVEHE